jgi:hypothetical protein
MPEETTEPQVFQLVADGAPVDLSGLTVGIEVSDKTRTRVTDPGTTAIVTAETGIVSFSPGAGKFTAALSPYFVRWTVSNGSTMFKVPNSVQPDMWQVPKP